MYIFVKTNDPTGTFWIDENLPTPSFILHKGDHSIVGWDIEGYFHTKKNREYFRDVKKRLLVTLEDLEPQIIDKLHHKDFYNPLAHNEGHIYSLRDLSENLESIPTTNNVVHSFVHNKEDSVFWEMKMHAEYLIKKFGSFHYLELFEYASLHFGHKERSTLKAKAKSIYNWYEERDFKIPNRKRSGKTIFELNKEKTIKTIKKLEKTVRQIDDLPSLRQWAKKANVSVHSVKKYLKNIQRMIFKFSIRTNHAEKEKEEKKIFIKKDVKDFDLKPPEPLEVILEIL